MLKSINNNPIAKFLFRAGLTYLLWIIIYDSVIKPHTKIDRALSENLVYSSHKFFSWLGVETVVFKDSTHVVIVKSNNDMYGVWVGDPCNGLTLFSVFAIFILFFPGSVKSKLWFIPAGIILLHLLNVFRIMGLVEINHHFPEWLHFNHTYTFTIAMYTVIFGMWYLYGKKYSSFNAEKK